jgi:hypothetical protein
MPKIPYRRLISTTKNLFIIIYLSSALFSFNNYLTRKSIARPSKSNMASTFQPKKFKQQSPIIRKNDRVSPINFKRICDWHFGRELVPVEDATSLRNLDANQAKHVANQSVIFVGSPYIREFYTIIRPLLNISFVLVTGDTDDSIPMATLSAEMTIDILTDKSILHWYAMNCDMPLKQQQKYPNFSCLMNGISQWQGQRENMQRAYELGIGLKEGVYQDLEVQKSKWILSAFAVSTNVTERQKPYDLGCNDDSPLKDITTCYYKSGIDPLELYKDIARHKFVLAPHGVGLDCYRTYETLFLGSYPIVKTSSLDFIYKELPVLIVQKWEDVNLELIEKTYREFRAPENQKRFNYDQLYVDYWNNTFRSYF